MQVQVTDAIRGDLRLHCMSGREWITRLTKGDVSIRAARRGRKTWILGSWEELVRRERAELDSKRLLLSAQAEWREELSDEWDEDWDPFADLDGTGR